MNITTVTGNVGKVRFSAQNNVLNLNVASHDQSRGKRYTTWFNVEIWGPRAKALKDHVLKGQAVFVTGRVKAEAYSTKAGNPAANLVLVCDKFQFVGPRPDGGEVPSDAHDAAGTPAAEEEEPAGAEAPAKGKAKKAASK